MRHLKSFVIAAFAVLAVTSSLAAQEASLDAFAAGSSEATATKYCLGVYATTWPIGAHIDRVIPGGAAEGKLASGDVILIVNPDPVGFYFGVDHSLPTLITGKSHPNNTVLLLYVRKDTQGVWRIRIDRIVLKPCTRAESESKSEES